MNSVIEYIDFIGDIMPHLAVICVFLYIIFVIIDFCILKAKEKELLKKEKEIIERLGKKN